MKGVPGVIALESHALTFFVSSLTVFPIAIDSLSNCVYSFMVPTFEESYAF